MRAADTVSWTRGPRTKPRLESVSAPRGHRGRASRCREVAAKSLPRWSSLLGAAVCGAGRGRDGPSGVIAKKAVTENRQKCLGYGPESANRQNEVFNTTRAPLTKARSSGSAFDRGVRFPSVGERWVPNPETRQENRRDATFACDGSGRESNRQGRNPRFWKR